MCVERAPLIPLLYAFSSRFGNTVAFRLPEVAWDHFHCAVEPSPGHARRQRVKFHVFSFSTLHQPSAEQ